MRTVRLKASICLLVAIVSNVALADQFEDAVAAFEKRSADLERKLRSGETVSEFDYKSLLNDMITSATTTFDIQKYFESHQAATTTFCEILYELSLTLGGRYKEVKLLPEATGQVSPARKFYLEDSNRHIPAEIKHSLKFYENAFEDKNAAENVEKAYRLFLEVADKAEVFSRHNRSEYKSRKYLATTFSDSKIYYAKIYQKQTQDSLARNAASTSAAASAAASSASAAAASASAAAASSPIAVSERPQTSSASPTGSETGIKRPRLETQSPTRRRPPNPSPTSSSFSSSTVSKAKATRKRGRPSASSAAAASSSLGDDDLESSCSPDPQDQNEVAALAELLVSMHNGPQAEAPYTEAAPHAEAAAADPLETAASLLALKAAPQAPVPHAAVPSGASQ